MSTLVYNIGELETPKEKLLLHFGLFFDGTLNNEKNTKLRFKYLNQLEDGKKVTDYVVQPGDSPEIIAEKKAKSKYLILPTDDEETVLEKEKLIAKRREALNKNKSDYYQPYNQADERNWLDKQGVDNSLMNDFTNVARLYMCCDQKNYGIYIEGIGTEDKQKDIEAGFQYGSGTTGIRGKVRKGCEKLAEKVVEKIKANKGDSQKQKKITSVTLDVFGFSRGAAAARNFVYEVKGKKREEDLKIQKKREVVGYKQNTFRNYGNDYQTSVPVYGDNYYDKDDVKIEHLDCLDNGKMPKFGYLGYYLLKQGLTKEELQEISLHIRFIGVYDTVSSYEEFGDDFSSMVKGIRHSVASYFENDVEELQLNNLGNFVKAVHYTAMDEHRQNFALTRLKASGGSCKEFALPGVHCDIGGAYETGLEVVDEIETSNYIQFSKLDKFKKKLIADGWYFENQLSTEWESMSSAFEETKWYHKVGATIATRGISNIPLYRKLTGKRFLKKEYSYIPLHFMEQELLSCPTTSKHIMILETTSEYSIDNEGLLIQAKNYLQKHTIEGNKKWELLTEEELNARKIKRTLEEYSKDLAEQTREQAMLEFQQERQRTLTDNLAIEKISPHRINPQINPQDDELKFSEIVQDDESTLPEIILEEVVVYSDQALLKKLRNQYFHWSANRDWLGMDPTSDRKRIIYPKEEN